VKKPIVVGAVLYDPKVSIIWSIISDFFESKNVPMDVVYYTNYKLQVEGLAKGHLDVAWNSPLAWLDTVRQTNGACRAIAMRDTDRDRRTHIVVRKGAGIEKLADLADRTLAFGAKDSPQATLIPLQWLSKKGLKPGSHFKSRRFDVLVGKHGDHIGGELEAFRCLAAKQADACMMIDLNWTSWTKDGTVNASEFQILETTGYYDHCVFAVREGFPAETEKRFLDALFSMTYDNPAHREMMDMEGLRAWMPGRTTGFEILSDAIREQRFFEEDSQ
jgi:ABC-type phosphate/phosphonate transport system substrate-binding protein